MTTSNIDLLLSDITFRRGWLAKMLEVTVHDGDDTRFDAVSIVDLIHEVRALREQRDAERAVIAAAKAQESELHRLLELGVNERPDAHTCLEFARSKSGIKEAVRALRAIEGDA